MKAFILRRRKCTNLVPLRRDGGCNVSGGLEENIFKLGRSFDLNGPMTQDSDAIGWTGSGGGGRNT